MVSRSLQIDSRNLSTKIGAMEAQFTTSEHLQWIVCPVCRQSLQFEGAWIRCQGCGKRYPIVDGIPVLLADRAG
jgi:hypothetical protein